MPARGVNACTGTRRPPRGIVLTFVVLTAFVPVVALAQVVRDGTIGPACAGPACALAGPAYQIGDNLGKTSSNGRNLFHSFSQFNLINGESATFSGAPSILNVITRVTGGRSSIDGTIASTIAGANLFFLNPQGVFFGPNASLSISGSFHVSTADFLRFSDGTQFFSDPSRDPTGGFVALNADPLKFGFLTNTPASIEISGSSFLLSDGATLSIIGGDIKIAPPADDPARQPMLAVPGGRLYLASVASAGEVVPGLPGSPAGLDVSSFSLFGRIDVSSSIFNVSEASPTGAGTVVIRGGQLFVKGSQILSQTFSDVAGETVGIDFRTTGAMEFTEAGVVGTVTGGSARSGDVILSAGDLLIDGVGTIVGTLSSFSTGTAGNTTITAGRLTLSNGAVILSDNQGFAPARGGDIAVHVSDAMTISGGAGILSATEFFDGDGGNITVSAKTLAMTSGGSIFSQASGDGRAGAIGIAADRLTMTDGARVTSSAGVTGAGGAIEVNIADSTFIAGIDSLFNPTGIFSSSGGGPAGRIALVTGTLDLRDGARIQSGDFLIEGGDIAIRATGDILVANGAGILSQTFVQPVGAVSISARALTVDNAFIQTSTLGPGRAGAIAIHDVSRVSLLNGGQVLSSSESLAEGAGGSVTVTAAESLTIAGSSSRGSSGIFSTAAATGNAGEITINTPTLTLADGGQLSVATSGLGNAGSVALTVGNLLVSGGGRVDSSAAAAGSGGDIAIHADSVSIGGVGSGLFSTASSTGNAGQIEVSATALSLVDGAKISVDTSGAGNAGAIALNLAALSLAGGARIDSSTTAGGRGGDIALNATSGGSLAGADGGLFSTASSSGSAGQIVVSAPSLTVSDNARISVVTSAAGNAGDIALSIGELTLASGARVDSSTSGAGRGGTIAVNGSNVSLAGGAVISSNTSGAGAGGSVTVSGTAITLAGVETGLLSTASGTGSAGQVVVVAPSVTVTDNATISVVTSGAGNAGDIALNVNALTLAGGARLDSSTSGAGRGGIIALNAAGTVTIFGAGMFSDASGTGAGGDINLAANQVGLTNATISATSTGTAAAIAGNINLVFGTSLEMVNSNITTNSLLADGGNISITSTGSTLHVLTSSITTSVQSGVGGGGNITIGSLAHPLDIIVLDGSQIRADAFGGPGGNINILADVFLTQNTIVSASSALAAPGTIAIQAQVTDVTGALAQLPESVLEAAALLRASCMARLAEGKASSLVVAGRAGVPPAPDAFLWSPLTDVDGRTDAHGVEWPHSYQTVALRAPCVR